MEPNSLVLVLDTYDNGVFKVMIFGDEQRTECFVTAIDFMMDTFSV